MLAIFKRELRSYFTSPIGYIYIAVYLAVSGFLFSYFTLQNAGNGNDADVSSYFLILLFLFVILVPLLTMKLFSEERKLKIEQLLLTSPISLTAMVTAKFLAAYVMFAGSFLVSCLDLLLLFDYGAPTGAILIGYMISILLVGGAFVAVGVFVSALTENQLIAAIGTMALLAVFLLANFLNQYINTYAIRAMLNWVSIFSRFTNFTYGLFDPSALLYYISIVVVFLFLTVRVYEKRRWE